MNWATLVQNVIRGPVMCWPSAGSCLRKKQGGHANREFRGLGREEGQDE